MDEINKKVEQALHSFTIEDFKKSVDTIIATSDNSYRKQYNILQKRVVKEYTIEQVNEIIERGSSLAQKELSYNYFSKDGFYRRIVIYYATFLKYLGILIPNASYTHSITEPSIKKRYYRAMDFIDRMDIQTQCINFMTKAIIDGTYYGIIQTINRENFTILDLPFKYCSSRYKDLDNNDIIEFDLGYFDSLLDSTIREGVFDIYPPSFYIAYRNWKESGRNRWYMVPSDIGICFQMFDGRPFFLSTIPEIVNYRDYETLEKKKDTNETKKIVIQKIPHTNEGKLLFEPDEAVEIHRGTVNMLSPNQDISVLTTYADIDVEGVTGISETAAKSNLEKISNTIFKSAGVSPQVFAASGNMALNVSIQNDLALAMAMANKFSVFFTNIINRLYGNSNINFKYQIMPISYYNEKEYIDNAYKEATAGYSFLLPALALGLNQKDIVSIKEVENKLLSLQDYLVPLKTSFTNSNSGETPAGRPELPDDKKTDKTARNIDPQKTKQGG